MVTRHLPSGAHRDDAGRLRLVLPPQRLADYLALALDEAAPYGADSRQVQQRLDALLADVRAAALPEHGPALTVYAASRTG